MANDPTNGRHRLLTPKETADLLNVSWRTLEGWRQRGHGPPHVRLSGRRIRYRSTDVDRWIQRQIRASTAAERPPAEAAS